jgi:hypothetical protein
VKKRGPQELFHLAATEKPGILVQETDLFAGIPETNS